MFQDQNTKFVAVTKNIGGYYMLGCVFGFAELKINFYKIRN